MEVWRDSIADGEHHMSKNIHLYETKMEGGKKKAETERLSIIAFKEQEKVSFNLICIKGPLFQFPKCFLFDCWLVGWF